MRKLYRYEYVKKAGVDFLFFSAPWVKQGNSSFTSKVSLQVLKASKRSLNNVFFGTQRLYLINLIDYFFQRYNEDVRRFTYYEVADLYSDLYKLLLLNCGSKHSVYLDFKTLFQLVHSLNLFMGSSSHYRLSKLFFCFANFYNIFFIKKRKYSFFSLDYIRAKNSLLFYSIRTNNINILNSSNYGNSMKALTSSNISGVASSKLLLNKFNEII